MLVDTRVVSVDFNGIVLFSWPDLLDKFSRGIKEGENILDLFIKTGLGGEVVDARLVIPVINIDDGDYPVRIFLEDGPGICERRKVVFFRILAMFLLSRSLHIWRMR